MLNREVELKEDTSMDAADSYSHVELTSGPNDHIIIPLQQQLAQIDQLYPPNRLSPPESFQSVGQKRRRLNESESATSVKLPTQTAASLYRDALHSIYQFLNLREFVRTCVISKTWYSAGQQMRSRKDYLRCLQPVFLLVQSPLRYHITRLNLPPDYNYGEPSHHLDPSSLLLLQYRMGHLEELRMSIKLNKSDIVRYVPSSCFTIPQQLQMLEVNFMFGDDDWESELNSNGALRGVLNTYILECLKQIALHSRRLIKLRLELPTEVDDCSQPLRMISTLTNVALPAEVTQTEQIDLIKSLPMIRIWHTFWVIAVEDLQRLVGGSGPPPLLEDIGKLHHVDEPMANELNRLTTLTKLEIDSMRLTDPTKLLPNFPRLSFLKLHCIEGQVDVTLLATALSACISLTSLDLTSHELRSEHLTQCLPHLNSLVILKFKDCVGLVSLRFLTTSSQSLGNLRLFSIFGSTQLPITEYHHLRSISRSLEELEIICSTIGRFDPLTIGRWTPGSNEFIREEWPKLKSFELYHPRAM